MDKPIRSALLIDDNEIDQRGYLRIIERSGLVEETIPFLLADEALAYLEANSNLTIDVIFLDINMPRMNGFEFLDAAIERLGNNFASVVVVMLTTSLDPSDRERAESFDVVKDYIYKPLTVEDVRRVVALLSAG